MPVLPVLYVDRTYMLDINIVAVPGTTYQDSNAPVYMTVSVNSLASCDSIPISNDYLGECKI